MIIAEKLQIIVRRGEKNTRDRDLFDINFLMQNKIREPVFKELVNKVFKARRTKIPDNFFNAVSKKDTKRMEESWAKYEKSLDEQNFNRRIWEPFKKNLHKIDSLLN